MLRGIGVVRMHLHREVIARVKNLDKQREAISLGTSKEVVMACPEL